MGERVVTSRTRPDAGWARRTAARGPSGRLLCRACGNEVPPGRTTFCSGRRARLAVDGTLVAPGSGCVHEWLLGSDDAYQRKLVLARDRGVCAACSLDTLAAWQQLEALRAARWMTRHPGERNPRYAREWTSFCAGDDVFMARWEVLTGTRRGLHRKTLWDMDHVVPVVEGGGYVHGVDPLPNLRTLCLGCHRVATAALAKRRATQRKDSVVQ